MVARTVAACTAGDRPDVTIRVVKRLPAVRERTEELERASLSTWATLAAETKGRDRHEEPDRLRTAFQCDRDRILHADAFRRLACKSRMVVRGDGRDRTCLVHTLEVLQLAHTIGRGLRLNEDLVEAITLGHDLGHTPFGHAGEEALSAFTPAPFRHGEQGLRLVERLGDGGRGLNLTWEVRDGIVNHTWSGAPPATPEGQVVRLANRIAGLDHDLDDALAAGLVRAGDVPREVRATLGETRSQRLTAAAEDVVAASLDDPEVQPEVQFGPRVAAAVTVLREFLVARVYLRPPARAERDRAVHCLRSIAVFYLENPSSLPEPGPDLVGDPLVVRVCDFVAGLTDRDAVEEFARRFQPAT